MKEMLKNYVSTYAWYYRKLVCRRTHDLFFPVKKFNFLMGCYE